jgi:hypothetical protein
MLAILFVWFGARPVLHNAVFGEPPATPPLVGRQRPADPPPGTVSPPSDSSTVATPPRTVSQQPRDRTYAIRGGKVVLSVTATSVRLVSATPSPGYEMRTWHGDGWLRVDFTRGVQTSSLFATWNGHAPDVRVVG